MSLATKNPPSAPPETPAPTPAERPADSKPPKKEKGGKPKEEKGKSGKSAASGAPSGKKILKPIPDNPNFRYIVRFAGSDLDGRRQVSLALTGVRGIGLRMAAVACRMANVSQTEMIGNLPEATVEGIEAVVQSLPQQLPSWMLNHPADMSTGEVHHWISGDLDTSRRDDVNRMKMIRSYRGVRHERGQKVRGQRTRSNGRTGMAAGVLKKAAKEAAAAKSREGAAAPAAPAAPAPTAPATEKKKA